MCVWKREILWIYTATLSLLYLSIYTVPCVQALMLKFTVDQGCDLAWTLACILEFKPPKFQGLGGNSAKFGTSENSTRYIIIIMLLCVHAQHNGCMTSHTIYCAYIHRVSYYIYSVMSCTNHELIFTGYSHTTIVLCTHRIPYTQSYSVISVTNHVLIMSCHDIVLIIVNMSYIHMSKTTISIHWA